MQERKKLLIADGDEEFLKECKVNLGGQFAIVGMAKDGEDALKKIRASRPDAVLLELWLAKYDGCRVISEFAGENTPVFVVATGVDNMQMLSEASSLGAAYCVKKPVDFESLAAHIERLTDKKRGQAAKNVQKDLEAEVTETIHKIGVPANLKGHAYLRTAIMMAVNEPDAITALTKVLYPAVAKEHKTSATRVERGIRYAVESAWERGNIDTLREFFGYTVQASRGKPTNSEFIALIADDIRLKNKAV